MDDEVTAVTHLLRSAAENAVQTHGRHGLNEVQDAFLRFDPVLLATLSPVMLLPLKRVIESLQSSEAARISAFSCMTAFFTRTASLEASFTVQSIAYMSLALDERLTAALISSSEEVKKAIIESLVAVVQSATPDSMTLMETADQLPVLGHVISTLLAVGSTGSSKDKENVGITYGRSLRCAAIQAVQYLCDKIPHPATLSAFLPGIASSLGRVVTGDFKQGHAVFSSAILAWTSIIVRVVCDDEYYRCQANNTTITDIDAPVVGAVADAGSEVGAPATAEGLIAVQSDAWWTTTCENLRLMLDKMVGTSHSHYKVRLALVNLADNVLRRCLCTMTFAAPVLVELLVDLTADQYPDVSHAAKRALTDYAADLRAIEQSAGSGALTSDTERKGKQQARHTLQGLCEENLAAVLVSFPRVLHGAADDAIARHLTLIGSYLAILGTFGPRVKTLLRGGKLLTRMQHVLESVLEADASAVHLIAERLDGGTGDAGVRVAGMAHPHNPTDTAAPAGLSGGTTSFRWFAHKEVLHAAARICHLLGHFGDIHALTDHFVSNFRASAPGGASSQSALILGELLRGAAMPVQALAWATPPPATPPPATDTHTTPHDTTTVATSIGSKIVAEDDGNAPLPDRQGPAGTPDRNLGHTRSPPGGTDALVVLARTVVQALTDDDIWRLPTHRSDTEEAEGRGSYQPRHSYEVVVPGSGTDADGGARVFVANAILQSRLLNAIAIIAEALGPHFDELVIYALYPVLELFGSHTAAVTHAAGNTLRCMCNALGFTTVSAMVCHNSDYLVNSISLNMRYVGVNPRATIVFHSMLQTCDLEILPYLQDTIDEVFEAIDGFHTDARLQQFLSILHALASSFRRWDVGAHVQAPLSKAEEQAQREQEEDAFCDGNDNDEITRFLNPDATGTEGVVSLLHLSITMDELRQLVQSVHMFLQLPFRTDHCGEEHAVEKPSDAAVAAPTDEYIRVPLPFDWRDTMQHTIERCTHQLACSRPRLRLVVLDTMCHAAHALHHEEDHLLPAINTLWPALVARLRDPDRVVQMRAVEVVHDIVALAPAFMQSRIRSDVIPALLQLLGRMEWDDQKSKGGSVQISTKRFRHSTGFKIESALLRLLTAVLPSLDLATSTEGATLAAACFPYLSSNCPQELQSATRVVFEELMLHDPDAVWYLLVRRCAPSQWTSQNYIPAATAHLYIPPQLPAPDHTYRVNVDQLLAKLDEIES